MSNEIMHTTWHLFQLWTTFTRWYKNLWRYWQTYTRCVRRNW